MLRLLITWLGVFVFCQLNANAELSRSCDDKTTPTDCNNEAGCYWSTEGEGYCKSCKKNHYCPSENTGTKSPIACNTLGGGFNYTEDDGAGDETDCYKNINCYIYNMGTDCKQYYAVDGISCSGVFYPFGYNAAPQRFDVHLEKMSSSWSTATKCFTNVISCKKVKTNNCTQDNSKEAKYYYYGENSEDKYWDISACRCTQNTFLGSDPAANCYAAITKRPDPSTISYMETTVPIWERQNYHCTSCKPGWMPVSGTPDSNVCNPTPAGSPFGVITSICKCEKVPKGYYAENCSFEENSYYTLGTNNNCVTACPAGKTTNATGASDASACHYTDQTKFCDSKGCFSLSDIQTWTEVQ